jgi:hypothetical protein
MSRTEKGTTPLGRVVSMRATGRNQMSRSPLRTFCHRPSTPPPEASSRTPTTPIVTSGGEYSRTPRRQVSIPPIVSVRWASYCWTIRRSIRSTPGRSRRHGQAILLPLAHVGATTDT